MCNAMQSACVFHHFEVFLLFFYVLLLIGKIHRGFMSCFNLCVLIYKSVCVCVISVYRAVAVFNRKFSHLGLKAFDLWTATGLLPKTLYSAQN